MDKLSPVESAMVKILSDGLPHSRDELHECCDPTSAIAGVKVHLSNLRKKLPNGIEVVAIFSNGFFRYRMVRTLHSANDGRR